MSNPRYTIGVSGLNAIDSPGPGLAVIKALRDAESFDVRIIGLAYESMEPGLYMHDLVDKSYLVPYPSAGQDVLLKRLQYIHSVEKPNMLVPNFDAELFNYIKLQKTLEKDLGIKTFLPSEKQFNERHKSNLYAFGLKHGIKVPAVRMANTMIEATNMASQLGYPVVVKGKFYDARIASTPEQVMQYFSKISAQWGTPVLIQEFISGHEVNVCGIGNGKGETIGAVPMKKLYVTEKGKAWSGVTLADEKLLEICKNLVESTSWRGPFELEFMKTKNDEYYLLEINPRFPAWCYLSVGAGQNQVEALVKLAMGEDIKPFDNYEVGKMFIRYSNDMIVNLEEFESISTLGEL